MKNHQQIKYFAYLRKSSEAEDRQMQSIDAQRTEMEQLATRLSIDIIEYFEEAQSAKKPGRPIFNQMLDRIEKGEARGILCWKLNRLARNPIDGGRISWMLQNSSIEKIHTTSGQYLPTDNVLMMAVELGMANQFIKDLSSDTKRGLRERMRKGYTHGVAPIGYLNDLTKHAGDRGWINDLERFSLIKQILNNFANGQYSVRQILKEANTKWGLTSPIRIKQGGKPIARSYMYKILGNPVYAGFFFDKEGNRYELHKDVERMITAETHEKILQRLGKKTNPRHSKNENIYAAHSECGNCQRPLVKEQKRRVRCDCGHKFSYIKSESCALCKVKISDMEQPTFYDFDYIHCTKTRTDLTCKEPVVTTDQFKDQLANYLEENLNITPRLEKWCLDHVKELDDKELIDTLQIAMSRSSALEKAEQKYNNLLTLRISQTDPSIEQTRHYDEIEKTLLTEISLLKKPGSHDEKVRSRYQKILKDLNLAVESAEIIRNGTDQERKEILDGLNSKLVLMNRKLDFKPRKPLGVLIDGLRKYRGENGPFETKNPLDIQEDFGENSQGCLTLLRWVEDVRTCST